MKITQQKKSELRHRIAYAVSAMPEEKNVDIARLLNVSATHVGRVRKELKPCE